MKKTAFVYFITNTHNNVLYIGVTNNLLRRVAEHKLKINKGFTYKYNCDKLVYFEAYDLVIDAIAREKQLKNWKREWKNVLVNKENPVWNDLSEEIGVTKEFIESIRAYYEEIAGQARNDAMNEARNDAMNEARNDAMNEDRNDAMNEARNDEKG